MLIMFCAKKNCGITAEWKDFKRNSSQSNLSYFCQNLKKILNCIKLLQGNDRKRKNTQRLNCLLKLVGTAVHHHLIQGANMITTVKPSLCKSFCRIRSKASKQQFPADNLDSQPVVNFNAGLYSCIPMKSNLLFSPKPNSCLLSNCRNQKTNSFLQCEKSDKLSSNKKLVPPRNIRYKKRSIFLPTLTFTNNLDRRETWYAAGRKRMLSFTIFRIFCIFHLLFSYTATANGVWW